jgi:hypothetical protein
MTFASLTYNKIAQIIIYSKHNNGNEFYKDASGSIRVEENKEMQKIAEFSTKTSLKIKVILTLALLILGLAVAAMSFNIFKNNAPFVQDCQYQLDRFKAVGDIESIEAALSAISIYADKGNLSYEKYPIDYDESCHSKQYFFTDKKTQARFFVCKTGAILRILPINCEMNYNFSVIESATQIFRNTTG